MAVQSGNSRLNLSYGLTQALIQDAPQPIVSKRAPTTSDSAQIGAIWVQSVNTSGTAINSAWVLTSIISNSATWTAIGGGAGAGVFASLTVTPGPTALTGALTVTSGTSAVNISADAAANTVNIGTGAGAKAVTLGSTNTTSATTINAGTGAISLATAATGTISIGAATMTGALTVGQSTAGQTVSIASAINTGAQVVNIANGAAAADSTVNILSGTPTAGTATVNIGTGAYATQINVGSATGGNRLNIASNPFQIAGPIFIYTGAGAPAGGLANHVGDIYINTTAAAAAERMYIATGVGAWTNVTCAA